MSIQPNSIGNKIAMFNSYISSQSVQEGTASAAPKLINKLSGLSNTFLSRLSSPETGASAAKPRTAPKFSIYITNNNGDKTLSPLAKRAVQRIMCEDFPPTKGQTTTERYHLALNKLDGTINKIKSAKTDTPMPAIIRIYATPPSAPAALAATTTTFKEGVIPPPPPPPPLVTAPTPYVRKEIQAASKEEIEQHRAEQQNKIKKKSPESDQADKKLKGDLLSELANILKTRPKAE
ncbi:hypothetical protein [Yersinia proxima]|uniref:hypothetical protein n=1 Tax=Yersinia proxima TaxID=2890316 RepID=UPI001D12D230|nr:hypothetical protein [Yersinia proxima]